VVRRKSCISVAALLQLCCSSVAALLQICCSSVAALLQLYCSCCMLSCSAKWLGEDEDRSHVHLFVLAYTYLAGHRSHVCLFVLVQTCHRSHVYLFVLVYIHTWLAIGRTAHAAALVTVYIDIY
jgi:hypothetical protein